MDFNCPKCQKKVETPSFKIGFREECPHCNRDLHSCKNCHFYAPGKPNDCRVPGTDPIRDREAFNFCEEFQLKKQEENTSDQALRFFKDEEIPKKVDFDSLFKEDE